MLVSDALIKGLQIIETLRKTEFCSCEIFSDGSGQIIDDQANIVIQWDTLSEIEELMTKCIEKKGVSL